MTTRPPGDPRESRASETTSTHATIDDWRRRLRQALSPRTLTLCGLLLVLHTVLLVLLVRPADEPRLHQAPIAVVAPAAVSAGLAERANALPGSPLEAVPASDQRVATRDVANGVLVAALVMDLAVTEDLLVLSGGRDPQLNEAVEEQLGEVLRANGRTLRVTRTASPDEGSTVTTGVAVAGTVLGILMAMAVSLLYGPSPPRLRRGVRRVAIFAVASVLLGLGQAFLLFDTSIAARLVIALIVAASILMPATLTLAVGALVGLAGMALSVSLTVVVATPLLVATDPYLLPQPWRFLGEWAPPGASLQALEAMTLFDGVGLARPALVLLGWFAVGSLVMIVARQERDRASVVLHDGVWRSLGSSPPVDGGRRGRSWRLRVVFLVLPSAVLLTLLLAVVPLGDLPTVAPAAERAIQTRCVSTGPVESEDDLNRISRDIRGTGVFQGGDVGASVALQDGRRLFVFGDTIRRLDDGGQTFVRNSMLLLAPGCIQAVLPAGDGALIPDRSTGSGPTVGYWPMSVNVSHRTGYDLVTVAAQRVRNTGDGAFDFENLGAGVAVFLVAPGDAPQLFSVTDLGPDRTDITRPTWGAASVVQDGWAYMYGTSTSAEELTFGYALHVARVRPDHVQDLDAWQYWDGARWSRSAADAVPLIDAARGTSQTLSVFERDGTWYALSKRDEFLGSEVVVWTAGSPQGPFDDGRTLARLESNVDTGQLRYMPLAHPDLLQRPDSVIVSYSRNRTSVGTVLADPLQYRPRFMRVELP